MKEPTFTQGHESNCPVCHSNNVVFYVRHSSGKQNLLQCVDCGLYFAHPHVTTVQGEGDLGGGIKEQYWRSESAWRAFKQWREAETVLGAALIQEYAPCQKVLEIGFGENPMVSHTSFLCKEYWGVEPDSGAFNRVRGTVSSSAKLFCLGLEKLAEVEPFRSMHGYFDTVIIFNALPALPLPLESLRTVRGLMSDDAKLIISVPDSSRFGIVSLLRRLIGMEPYTYFFISFFNKRNFEILASSAGFRVIHWREVPNVTPLSTEYLVKQYGNFLLSPLIRLFATLKLDRLLRLNSFYVVLEKADGRRRN